MICGLQIPSSNSCMTPAAGLNPFRYFSDAFTEANLVLRAVPMLLTAVMITMLRPTAIRQYSMAVAPDSSRRNLEISFRIQSSCAARVAPAPVALRNLGCIGCQRVEEYAERSVKAGAAFFASGAETTTSGQTAELFTRAGIHTEPKIYLRFRSGACLGVSEKCRYRSGN